MPTCNLLESVHNVWLHMLGKKRVKLCDGAPGDLARATIQMPQNRQFIGRGEKNQGTIFLLHATHRQGSLGSFSEGIGKRASNFHDKLPHLEMKNVVDL